MKKNNENTSALRIEIPHGLSAEEFEKFLNKFNKMVDDAGVFDEIERTSRYIKKSQRDKKKRFDRLKTIQVIERKRRELEQEVSRRSPIL